VQQDQAVHRAHELVFGIAPAHDLRDRQLLQRLGDDLGEMRVERLARFSLAGNEILGLAVARLVQLVEVTPAARMKPSSAPRRLAGRVERAGYRRALSFPGSGRAGARQRPVIVRARRRGVA
jgi:hypothetical protein